VREAAPGAAPREDSQQEEQEDREGREAAEVFFPPFPFFLFKNVFASLRELRGFAVCFSAVSAIRRRR
jgi:hypothetical protein